MKNTINYFSFIDNLNKALSPINKAALPLSILRVLAVVTLQNHADENIAFNFDKATQDEWEAYCNSLESKESPYFNAFGLDTLGLLSQYSVQAIRNTVGELHGMENSGLLGESQTKYFINAVLEHSKLDINTDNPFVDIGLYELSNELLAKFGVAETYISWDVSSQATALLNAESKFVESPTPNSYLALISVILGKIDYRFTDSVFKPTYMENLKLQKFQGGFSIVPFGYRSKFSAEDDVFNRFDFYTNYYHPMLIQHLLQQVTNVVMVIVPESVLFSQVSSEVTLKEWLIKNRYLRNIVSLPGRTFSNTAIATSLLILDPRAQNSFVHMCKLENSTFIEMDKRSVRLINTVELAELLFQQQENVFSKNVSYEDIHQNAYTLSVNRYINDGVYGKYQNKLTNTITKKFNAIFEIQRPIAFAKLKQQGSEKIYELQAGDMPEVGYLNIASKEVLTTSQVLDENAASFLRENDLVLMVRGVIGKVGLVSKEILDKYEGRITVNQSGLILRLKDATISPIAALMALRSELGQATFQYNANTASAAISILALADLKNLPIPYPADEQELQKAHELFYQQIRIQEEIVEKQKQLQQLTKQLWSL